MGFSCRDKIVRRSRGVPFALEKTSASGSWFPVTFLARVCLITACKAHVPAVTQHDMPGIEINFANVGRVAGSVGKTAGTAPQVGIVFGYGEQSGGNEDAVQCGPPNVQRLTVLCYPVMLHRDAGEVRTGANNLHSERSLQISGCDAQGGWAAVNDAEST